VSDHSHVHVGANEGPFGAIGWIGGRREGTSNVKDEIDPNYGWERMVLTDEALTKNCPGGAEWTHKQPGLYYSCSVRRAEVRTPVKFFS